jgi:multimeric flavodoxin WrbA
MPAYKEADMIVFASPIYYFTMTAQIEAAIQRVYCIGKPASAKKVALLLSSGSPNVYDAAITQFKGFCAYTGIELSGVITANGAENKSAAKMDEIKAFAKAL